MGQEQIISKFPDARQQILHIAKDIILGKGFTAVGLNEILTTANVPKGSFYHYFKSKEQFGSALLEEYFDDYLIKLDITLSPANGDVKTRLYSYFQYWLESQCSDTTQDKCMVVKLSAEVTDLSEAMRVTLKNGTDRVVARLANCVQEGVQNGEFAQSLDVKTVTNEIYYMWIGATLLTKVHRSRAALESAMAFTCSKLNLKNNA